MKPPIWQHCKMLLGSQYLARTMKVARTYLVDAAERGDVDGLPAHRAGAADPGRVLAGAGVDNGADQNLQRVLQRGLKKGGQNGDWKEYSAFQKQSEFFRRWLSLHQGSEILVVKANHH